jgi:hypothetical protein
MATFLDHAIEDLWLSVGAAVLGKPPDSVVNLLGRKESR